MYFAQALVAVSISIALRNTVVVAMNDAVPLAHLLAVF
jgi:hypothetical protein